MDSIEDDLDILKMYKYQIEELDSKEYQEYIKYLNIFFSKVNKKDEKFNKEFLDGNYILIDTKNSKKKIPDTRPLPGSATSPGLYIERLSILWHQLWLKYGTPIFKYHGPRNSLFYMV